MKAWWLRLNWALRIALVGALLVGGCTAVMFSDPDARASFQRGVQDASR